MALLHASVLAIGGLLVAVPIVLHLVMRQQPKHLIFPALRFLQARREANRRRMQLKHWLLLLLRCGAILLAAAALARPSVASAVVGHWIVIGVLLVVLLLVVLLLAVAVVQRIGPLVVAMLGVVALLLLANVAALSWRASQGVAALGDTQAPVAAVMVFDTSPRMQYVHANRTRLEQAQQTAHWLIKQLPRESRVAIVELLNGAGVFSVDRGAADKAVDSLQTTAVPLSLLDVLVDAVQLARQSDLERKEVFVFTDLSSAAWDVDRAARLRSLLEEGPGESIYVIDVGHTDPQNFALGQIRLARQTLTTSGQLQLQVELLRLGPAGRRTVELHVEQPDPRRPIIVDGKPLLPQSVRRGLQTCDMPADGSQVLQFGVQGLEVGTHHGTVRIVEDDPLAIDQVRYFTIEVRPAWPVLVVAGENVEPRFLTDSLAPYEFRQREQARFDCEVIGPGELASRDLNGYSAVCLLDPPALPDAAWARLGRFVGDGGGLAVFLGRNATKQALAGEPALQVLPGRLARQWRSGGSDLYLAPRAMQHPILAAFRPVATSVPWSQYPVFRHWQFESLAGDNVVVLRYSNNQPALVERTLGQGRVLTMTTPISDPADRAGGPWNWLPTGFEPWPFVMLTNEMMLYLVEGDPLPLNVAVGRPATLRKRSDADPDRYQLFTPRGDWQEVAAEDDQFTVHFTDTPGVYRLKAGGGAAAARGFSANLSPEASRLERVDQETLDGVFGKDHYCLVRGRVELSGQRAEQSRGRELFAFLLLMAALVLGLENVLANRFYRSSGATRGK